MPSVFWIVCAVVFSSLALVACEDASQPDDQWVVESVAAGAIDIAVDELGNIEEKRISVDGVLVQTTWSHFVLPRMRTEWLESGYGHVIDFGEDGQLVSVAEGLFGEKHGVAIVLDAQGFVESRKTYVNGFEVERDSEEAQELLKAPAGSTEQGHDRNGPFGAYTAIRLYTIDDVIVESRWYDASGGLMMRTRYGAKDNYAHSFIFDVDGRLSLLGEVRYDMFDGFAYSNGSEVGPAWHMYADGSIMMEHVIGEEREGE